MATLKDVAARSGVSLSTVSIVARGQGDARKISAATQERVRGAMRELGYVPNAAARSLRGGSGRQTLALFWADDYRESMLARFLGGLHAAIGGRSLPWDVTVVSFRAGHLREASSLVGAAPFHMAIVANAEADDLAFLSESDPIVPIALYNRRAEGFASVAVDDAEVGGRAAELVLDSRAARGGGDAALCLTSSKDFAGAHARERAFAEGLAAAGVQTAFVELGENAAQAGYEAVLSCRELGRAAWIFAPSDTVAMGALHALHERGVAVPADMGVVAVGNGVREYSEHCIPPLTCVEIPMEEMAAGCVELLAGRIDEERTVEPRIALRESL